MFTKILVTLVALLHTYFLVLEMFLWTKPTGRRVFRLSAEFAEASKNLAANQGLYNGFLAGGLLWGVWIYRDNAVVLFFLSCVVLAGIYGALTVSKRIFWVQAMPGLLAGAALLTGI